jgi:carboxylesterase type B
MTVAHDKLKMGNVPPYRDAVALPACARPEAAPSFAKVIIESGGSIRTACTRSQSTRIAVAAQDRPGLQGPQRARLHVTV